MATTKIADITLVKQSDTILTLQTEKKYVESDIFFNISARSATTGANTASADVDTESVDGSAGGVNIFDVIGEKVTSEPTSGYYIRMKASGSGSSKVTEAGWVDTGALSAASTTAVKYFPITSATITQNAPTIENSTGIVTAVSSTTAGYMPALNNAASNTLQLTIKAADTYNTSTSDQTINANQWLTGAQTIKAVTTLNIDAANIKKNVIVKVGDSNNAGRIKNVTGTFTDASTVSQGQTAASAFEILSGYSAWVDGDEVKGSIPTKTSANLSASGDTVTVPAGYYAADASKSIDAGTITNNTTLPSGKTSSGTINRGSYIKIGAGYYPETYYLAQPNIGTATISSSGITNVDGKLYASTPAGTITNNTSGGTSTGTINRGSQIKIGTGFYDEDVYYTAQSNSGTVEITSSGTTSVDGYANATVAAGSIASGSATISSAYYEYNSTSDNFDVTGSATVSAPTVSTAGYVSSTEGTKAQNTATLATTVDKIVGSTSITGSSTKTPVIEKQAIDITGVVDASSGNATTTAPSSGVYIAVKSAENKGTLTATPTITTAGYGDATNHGIVNGTKTVGANASALTYVPIATTSASLNGRTVSYGDGWISSGSTSIPVGSITSGNATISSASFEYSSANNNFNISGSASIGAPSVSSAGYISSDEGTKTGNTATLSATVSQIVGSTTITTSSGTGTDTATKKPSIEKQAISISGVTDAASGNATTTAPSSGVYVAVKSAANTGKLTATPGVTTAGYGTTSNHGLTARTATYGAAESDVTYVPITTASVSISGNSVTYGSGWINAGSQTVSAGSVTLNAPSINSSTGLITSSATVSAGYISSSPSDQTLQLTTKAATTYDVSTTEQSIAAGTYLTGNQTIRAVTTQNIDAGNIKDGVVIKVGDSGSATRIKNVTGTFTDSSTVSEGQTAAGSSQILNGYSAWVDGEEVQGSIGNSVMTQGTTTVTDDVVTRGELSWTAGIISSGNLGAAVFGSTVATGKTANSYVDIDADAPVLTSGGYLYINKGYVDDVKISLKKLVPDGSDVKGHGDYLLSGHSAYDNDGTLVSGTIQSLAATTYNTSGSDQTISAGVYLSGNQTIKAVATSNIDAANIKCDVNVKVGDANNAGRIKDVIGTFTKANTVSSGQTAAAAGQILSGYSAWVDGEEVQGSIPFKTTANLSVDGKTVTASAGYYAAPASASVAEGTVTSGQADIVEATFEYNSTHDNFDITGSASIGAPSVSVAGYISYNEGTRNGNTAYLNADAAKIVGSTTITGTTTTKPSIAKQNVPSGVTQAASGDATTTAPSSGVYVAVKSDANTGTLTATPGVTTAGYGTSANHGIAANTATVGAEASDMTYIPILTATPMFTGGAVSGTATASSSSASLSTITNNSGITIDAAGSASRAKVTYDGAVSGWVTQANGADAYAAGSVTVLTGTTYYLNGVTLTAPSSGTRTFGITVPNGSSTVTFTFNVDASGNVTVTEA